MFKTSEECRLELVAHSNCGDFMPCSAARVSFGNEDKTGNDAAKDNKLMRYLAEHQHMTPFEYQHATFLIECPLFIRSQIMRHRSFSYNEISRRYTDESIEFWLPDKWREQSASNKQASIEEEVDVSPLLFMSNDNGAVYTYEEQCESVLGTYKAMLSLGVCREQARAVLPQSLLTKFYMGGNLRSWAHFIELRKDSHAQKEVQIIAQRIEAELRKLWPNSTEALFGEEESSN